MMGTVFDDDDIAMRTEWESEKNLTLKFKQNILKISQKKWTEIEKWKSCWKIQHH